ncbi:MAG TPA: hypothetical protein DCF84_07835 [Bacteroidetes bacterium]|nr:hypothetical protein [Bacteroidota bacterium]
MQNTTALFAKIWQQMDYREDTDERMSKAMLFRIAKEDELEAAMAQDFLLIDPDSHRKYVTFDVVKSLADEAMLDTELNLPKLCKAILDLDCFEHEEFIKHAYDLQDYEDKYCSHWDFPLIESNKENKIPAGPEEMKQLFDQCFTILKTMNFNNNFFGIDKRRSLTKMATKLEIFKDHRPSIGNSIRVRIDVAKLQTIGKACERHDSVETIALNDELSELESDTDEEEEWATGPTGPLWHSEGKHRAGNRCSACDTYCGVAETCERCMQRPETLTLSDYDSNSETDTDEDELMPNQEHNELYHRPLKRMRV